MTLPRIGISTENIDKALRQVLTLIAEHTTVSQDLPEEVLDFIVLVAVLVVLVCKVIKRNLLTLLIIALDADELAVTRDQSGEFMQHTE